MFTSWKKIIGTLAIVTFAALAAAGMPVSQASVTSAPNPGTSASHAAQSLKYMGTTTDLFGSAPVIPPFTFSPYSGPTNTTNFKTYIAQVATILSQLPPGTQDVPGSVIVNAKSSLIAMQAQMQAAALAEFDPLAYTSYISSVNLNLSTYLAMTNITLNNYYASVQATARKVYADALAAAATTPPSPAPTVTVTVTATPIVSPTPSPTISLYKPGSVIKKTYTCVKTVNGVTTKKVLKAAIVKCPVGYKLLKK